MTTTTDILPLLIGAGIQRLRDGGKEISGLCPMHHRRTGRPDRHPSWSVSKVNFRHHCFSCGYSGTLRSLLIDLTGSAPADLEIEIAQSSFLHEMGRVRDDAAEVLDPFITEFNLRHNLADVPTRLLEVYHLRRDAIDRYDVRWKPDTKQWVLPIRSPLGALLGAQYRQKGSVLTSPKGMAKGSTLFGFSKMSQFDYVVLVESPLDAVRLNGLGIPAVSSLGAWVSSPQMTLLARNFATVYCALDNDAAGQTGQDILTLGLSRRGTAVIPWDYTGLVDEDGEPAKDPGDAADDDMLVTAWERTRRWGM